MSAGSNMMDLIVFKMVDTTLTATYTFMHPRGTGKFICYNSKITTSTGRRTGQICTKLKRK